MSPRSPESSDLSAIIYTHTDEAPLLATYSFLPIIQAYAGQAGVAVDTRDISLAGRVIAQFPERLTDEQRLDDALAELGELAMRPEANIMKLPNISASIPQLKAASPSSRGRATTFRTTPTRSTGDEEKEIRARYDAVKGSAVNPVLRQGNSDRRAPQWVKHNARKIPPPTGPVAGVQDERRHMGEDDFRTNEKSAVGDHADAIRIELIVTDGRATVLREAIPVLAGEVVDGTVMKVANLRAFLLDAMAPAKAEDVLFSVHLKATMMKVSDPIIFGHVVKAFFARVFATVRRGARRRRTVAQRRAGRDPRRARRDGRRRGDQGRDPPRNPRPAHALQRRLRPGHHQPPRAQRRHRRRLDARPDSQRRQAVGR